MITKSISDPMIPQRHRVQRILRETLDTFTLELTPVSDNTGFSFAAGQFNMLYIFGVGEVPISISGSPERPEMLVHTVRALGTVTKAMRRLQKGDMVGVRGPFGSHWPVVEAEGKDVLIVAGGIGLAPLRPVLYYLLSHRERYSRISLLYGARMPKDLLYPQELKRWRGRFDLEVYITVDIAKGGWFGNVGVVTGLISRALPDPLNTVIMICGPEVMMRFTVMEIQKRGVKSENIFISMERNMKCGVGFCGHCQLGPNFICKDGPIFRYDLIQQFFGKREI